MLVSKKAEEAAVERDAYVDQAKDARTELEALQNKPAQDLTDDDKASITRLEGRVKELDTLAQDATTRVQTLEATAKTLDERSEVLLDQANTRGDSLDHQQKARDLELEADAKSAEFQDVTEQQGRAYREWQAARGKEDAIKRERGVVEKETKELETKITQAQKSGSGTVDQLRDELTFRKTQLSTLDKDLSQASIDTQALKQSSDDLHKQAQQLQVDSRKLAQQAKIEADAAKQADTRVEGFEKQLGTLVPDPAVIQEAGATVPPIPDVDDVAGGVGAQGADGDATTTDDSDVEAVAATDGEVDADASSDPAGLDDLEGAGAQQDGIAQQDAQQVASVEPDAAASQVAMADGGSADATSAQGPKLFDDDAPTATAEGDMVADPQRQIVEPELEPPAPLTPPPTIDAPEPGPEVIEPEPIEPEPIPMGGEEPEVEIPTEQPVEPQPAGAEA
jgi:hypothetical protein